MLKQRLSVDQPTRVLIKTMQLVRTVASNKKATPAPPAPPAPPGPPGPGFECAKAPALRLRGDCSDLLR